jgi:hypothetical protein
MGYSPDSNDVSTEDGESPLLRAVTKQRLVKTQRAGKGLGGCCGDLSIVKINGGAVIACSSESCV